MANEGNKNKDEGKAQINKYDKNKIFNGIDFDIMPIYNSIELHGRIPEENKKSYWGVYQNSFRYINNHATRKLENINECLDGRLIELIDEKLGEGESINIIDLGCGRGVCISDLKEKYAEQINAYAADIYLKKDVKEFFNENNIIFYEIDLEKIKIPCENNHFDIIYTSMLLTQMKNGPGMLFDEILRTLKVGGKYLFYENSTNSANLEGFLNLHENLIHEKGSKEIKKIK